MKRMEKAEMTRPMLSDQESQIITYYFMHRNFESLCFAACLRCVFLCATVHDELTKSSSRFLLRRSIRPQMQRYNMKRMDANHLRETGQRAKNWSKLCRIDLKCIHFDYDLYKTMSVMKGEHSASSIAGLAFFRCCYFRLSTDHVSKKAKRIYGENDAKRVSVPMKSNKPNITSYMRVTHPDAVSPLHSVKTRRICFQVDENKYLSRSCSSLFDIYADENKLDMFGCSFLRFFISEIN